MAYKLTVLPDALNEIADATAYYFNISEKVALKFNKRLDEGFDKLELNPNFQKRYRNVRMLPVKKFPYIIIFEINEEAKEVLILSVFCTHQNPEKYP